MKVKAQLEKDIINISMKIHREFPELSKYIAEMPDFFSGPDTNQIRTSNFREYYNSLEEVLKEYSKTHESKKVNNEADDAEFVGYPMYVAADDIYHRAKKVADVDPNDLSKNKVSNEQTGTMNEKDFGDDMSGDDLDVPGSELDDQQEQVGSEDEENDYYSLGGDNHNDLEEDQG